MSHYSFVLPLAVLLPAVFYYFGISKKGGSFTSIDKIQPAQEVKKSRSKPTAPKPVQWYRDLFYQLQHLEDHPAVLEPARDELLAMFSRGISLALERPQGSIFSIEQYDAKGIWSFIEGEHEKVLTEWTSYLERRKQGQSPELFATTQAAKAWLVQQAPVKFVDGAWLAHTHKITTPFALRHVTKDAWQVLSEELGDGDLSKHHVYLYRQLLKEIGCPLPEGHSADFIKPAHWDGVNNRGAWEAAVGQLLISLFPNEFLPEILGFNMHYELITLDTMRAAHELKALGINPYYFLIHISIDNADSGHTAMAIHAVTRYLDMVRATEGEVALEQAWKRVQVGYTLSQTLGSVSHERKTSSSSITVTTPNIPLDPLSARVIGIFKAKASVSHQFHCHSRARIGGQTLAQWLAPSMWTDPHPQQHLDLLTALSQAKPWIYPGSSSKSLLVRELSWEGRMFGAFTLDELAALTAWIDSLSPDNSAWLYWGFTYRAPLSSKAAVGELQDPTRHHPVVPPFDSDITDAAESLLTTESQEPDSELRIEHQPLAVLSSDQLPDVVALWFAHIGLLENTINAPSQTASPLYASILRLLRAQAGFAVEAHIVAGMDEMKRLSCPSLVNIGLELVSHAGWGPGATPSSLEDVLQITGRHGQRLESARLAHRMLRWGARPGANLGLLLGLALAFLELKDAVARTPGLLEPESRVILEAIVARERQSLGECAQELRGVDGAQYKRLVGGYRFGRSALEKCL
ncbi:hypothetical protein BO70DRAFT_288869 [Aspergillus heteromorphus CBS 117.55]|uniref:Uncharacterized protein n=1 Tax=Aspergillus heteromorphus CBS 117.55 TaxID=1448321 RepID=A0A317WML8_9EURO|nr:uncharacterized protein BO70DRAFT_288869 [Aspergillus heteromorphus CBS 117.55]PWY86278.1 hypothetical protein BO70DRAFT_288869 [Aspergillus heteromorphus CBS 117.55]